MRQLGRNVHLVSNGDQTDTLYEMMERGITFENALASREREPDAPNFTARISGMIVVLRHGCPEVALSLLRVSAFDTSQTDRFTYRPHLVPGFGFGLTTYNGDGNPLPPFTGDPLILPVGGTIWQICNDYWQTLDAANRVALAIKVIPLDGSPSLVLIKNQY